MGTTTGEEPARSTPADTGRIVVVGEALVDVVVGADGAMRPVPGGGPYNVARTIGRLGGPVALATAVSTDRFGTMLRDGLERAGVDTSLVVPSERPSPMAIAQIDRDGQATYRFSLGGTSLDDALAPPVPDGTFAVITGGLALCVSPWAERILDMLGAAGPATLRVVDLNVRPAAVDGHWHHYRRLIGAACRAAHVVKASTEDLDAVFPEVAPAVAARRLVDLHGIVVIVTSGDGPIDVVGPGGHDAVPVRPVAIVDTIGAGDAFVGGFVEALRGWVGRPDEVHDLEVATAAVRAGIDVSSWVVGRQGADPPPRSQLGPNWPGDGPGPRPAG